jgi:PAS domain S-box-containing protein
LSDISPRRTAEIWKVRWEELKKGNAEPSVTTLMKKDGTLVDVEVRTTIFEFDGEELSFTSFNDITERKKAEIALIKSNERYENAMIATSEVIWEADLIEDTFYLSNNYTLVFGYPVNGLERYTNNSRLQNILPADKERISCIRAEILEGAIDNWNFEYKLKKADGNYADVLDRGFCIKDEGGTVTRLVGTMQDVTKQRAEENRLRLLESVVVNTNDVVIITEAEPYDLPGPKILYVNETFTKTTGYSFEEVIGQTPRMLQSEKTDRNELDKLRDSLSKWEACEATVCNKRKNGEDFWVNLRITPVANEKGWFTHWISIQREITRERVAELEKNALINELSNHITELKQFGYITTHNLRSPLTNLVSISKLLDERKVEDERTRKLISIFKESTHQLNDTVNDLIRILFIKDRKNIATIELGFEEELEKVTNSLIAILQNKGAKLETDFTLAPNVEFNPNYLESIFHNLLTNSIKYAHPKRRPIIKLKTEKTIEGKTKLYYSDNGLGMDMNKVRERIFGLHQRFHEHPESNGLGLYLIHSQITALKGTIEVDSEEGVGTTFTITFS